MSRASAAGQDVQDVQDEYAGQLYDQQATSANLHARFSASDLSDTTSEYSHSLFSVRTADRDEAPSPTSAHYLASHGHIPTADRERLNDPSCSSLDFGDDDYDDDDESPPASLCDDQDDSDQSCMSSLGPKMRFHSRAPWEMEDTPHENETTHELTRTITNKTMAQAAKLFHFGPSSPRVSNVVRTSGESVHAENVHKISMDSSAGKGRGTVYLHKQAAISNVSLGRLSNDPMPDPIRRPSLVPPSPSSTKSFPYTTPLASRISVDADPARLKQASFDYGVRRESTDNSRIFFSSPAPSELQRSYHPYANPDLAISHPYANPDLAMSRSPEPSPEPYNSSESLSVSREIASSGSINTVTESSASSSESTGAATLTPDSSTSSVEPSSTLLGREISNPVPLASHGLPRDKDSGDSRSLLPSDVHKLSGWTEKATPSFGLISLEEARARRARSVTQPPLTSRPSNGNPDVETTPEPETGTVVQGTQLLQELDSKISRSRSSSAGAKVKNALQGVKGAQNRAETLPGPPGPAPGKSLKQKKSGFLRLLIGSKAQNQEARIPPPPVPALPDTIASNGLQQIVSRTSRGHRVPVPKLTVVPGSVEGTQDHDDNDGTSPTGRVGPKRIRPLLSIGTEPSQQVPTLAISGSPQMQTVTVDNHKQQWLAANASRSAPANIHNFPPAIPPLQLRPVSMLFRSHFEDHLSKEDSRPSLETDTSELRSPSCYSPMTPRSIGQFGNEKIQGTPTENDDQSTLIKALQEQLASSNHAWQGQVRELEGQIRDLKAQLDELNGNPCETCGRDLRLNVGFDVAQQTKTSIFNRSRARMGNPTTLGKSID